MINLQTTADRIRILYKEFYTLAVLALQASQMLRVSLLAATRPSSDSKPRIMLTLNVQRGNTAAESPQSGTMY